MPSSSYLCAYCGSVRYAVETRPVRVYRPSGDVTRYEAALLCLGCGAFSGHVGLYDSAQYAQRMAEGRYRWEQSRNVRSTA